MVIRINLHIRLGSKDSKSDAENEKHEKSHHEKSSNTSTPDRIRTNPRYGAKYDTVHGPQCNLPVGTLWLWVSTERRTKLSQNTIAINKRLLKTLALGSVGLTIPRQKDFFYLSGEDANSISSLDGETKPRSSDINTIVFLSSARTL